VVTAKIILNKLDISGKLIAFDYDKKAASTLPKILLINDNFSNMKNYLKNMNISSVDGFLCDLGLSSLQIDNKDYGLSYRFDSLLDMQINKNARISAKEIINNYSFQELADIFYYYGEERRAKRIARKICEQRRKEEINPNKQLANTVVSCFPRKNINRRR